MTMSFLLQDDFDEFEPIEIRGADQTAAREVRPSQRSRTLTRDDKFKIPHIGPTFGRERLIKLVGLSVEQYGATLMSGRAGTGKTVLAADFALRQKRATWYSVEAADVDWPEFALSLSRAWGSKTARLERSLKRSPDSAEISQFLMNGLRNARRCPRSLLILDNVHHLFDAEWFPEFFRQMIVALDPETRLLMLCRSRPSAPLWRLRSKQMLNVIDESVLNLTRSEVRDICAARGISPAVADEAFELAFGNIAKLVKILNNVHPANSSITS
jgi:ATP/maltotriose-dependent transcriptional regulator MalT